LVEMSQTGDPHMQHTKARGSSDKLSSLAVSAFIFC
jgi:hypothetical protein